MITKHSGFTLIEVMAAVAIIGIVLTVLSQLEMRLMQSVQLSTRVLMHSAFIEQFWQEARMRDADEYAKSYGDVHCTYKRIPVVKESSLAKIRNLMLERVELQYNHAGRELREVAVSMWYKKPEEKKKDEERLQSHRGGGSHRAL